MTVIGFVTRQDVGADGYQVLVVKLPGQEELGFGVFPNRSETYDLTGTLCFARVGGMIAKDIGGAYVLLIT
jgi:hypothetical protein